MTTGIGFPSRAIPLGGLQMMKLSVAGEEGGGVAALAGDLMVLGFHPVQDCFEEVGGHAAASPVGGHKGVRDGDDVRSEGVSDLGGAVRFDLHEALVFGLVNDLGHDGRGKS
jgi:hypothetical protein